MNVAVVMGVGFELTHKMDGVPVTQLCIVNLSSECCWRMRLYIYNQRRMLNGSAFPLCPHAVYWCGGYMVGRMVVHDILEWQC